MQRLIVGLVRKSRRREHRARHVSPDSAIGCAIGRSDNRPNSCQETARVHRPLARSMFVVRATPSNVLLPVVHGAIDRQMLRTGVGAGQSHVPEVQAGARGSLRVQHPLSQEGTLLTLGVAREVRWGDDGRLMCPYKVSQFRQCDGLDLFSFICSSVRSA